MCEAQISGEKWATLQILSLFKVLIEKEIIATYFSTLKIFTLFIHSMNMILRKI